MQALTYLPLEPYRCRMSELMSGPDGWFAKVFGKSFCTKILLPDDQPSTKIVRGKVLDTHRRSLWAMAQIRMLLEADTPDDHSPIYFDDFFHPGLEAVAYNGLHLRRKCYAFCWAQTFDQFDFTRAPDMLPWMRQFEKMAMEIYHNIFVASPILKDFICTAFPRIDPGRIVVAGLPFNSQDVLSRVDHSYECEQFTAVYSSRLDTEKNPGVFLSMSEYNSNPEHRFAICTADEELRGDPTIIEWAEALEREKKLTILRGLEKPQYYSVLNRALCQVNTGMQDWVSFTLLEALTFKCIPVYPRHRDFVHVFRDAPHYLYTPDNAKAALEIVEIAANVDDHEDPWLNGILSFNDGAIENIANVIANDNLDC